MRSVLWLLLGLAAAGCKDKGGDTATDDTADTGEDPFAGDAVQLSDEGEAFEDLWFSETLDRVLAVVPFSEQVALVNPDTLETTLLEVPGANFSTAISAGEWVVTLDRSARKIRSLDPVTGELVDEASSVNDIVLIRPAVGETEIWAAEPIKDQIEVFSINSSGGLIRQGSFEVDRGPIGLVADDSRGLVFTGLQSGEVVGIDTTTQELGEPWLANCNAPFESPAVDTGEGLLFVGCETSARVTIFDTDDDGDFCDEVNLGANATRFAWSQSARRLYVRSDPGDVLSVFDVDADGLTTALGELDVPWRGAAMATDNRGQVWVTSTEDGRLVRRKDTF